MDAYGVLLLVTNIEDADQPQLYFSVELADIQYFFACTVISWEARHAVRAAVPEIYRAERRDLARVASPKRKLMMVEDRSSAWRAVELIDESPDGVGIRVPQELAESLPMEVRLRTDSSDTPVFARVRHRNPDVSRSGWVTIGLSVSSVPTSALIPIDHRNRILGRRPSLREVMSLARASVSALIQRTGLMFDREDRVNVVEYQNERSEMIRAIENSWGDPSDCVAVIVPPAWGRTKETFLPLAITLVETFRSAGEPIRVIRFDGTNRRGESYIEPSCQKPGAEHLRFTFSQAARDISATVNFLSKDPERAPRKIILVTFSLASVEARHALVSELRISGWVSVVGMADLQSALKTISGGIDFGNGLLRGASFGKQELVGVVADMDYTGLDAIQSRIVFAEDARREMFQIKVPITWIHGKYDAWMDLDRVVECMSCGDTENRRIIEVPTGHHLRSGRKALETFQLVAEEVSEMALGDRRFGVIPRVSRISAGRVAELARLPRSEVDLRMFWANYLLGRTRVLGMELLSATAAYRAFMEEQVRMLQLRAGQRIADLGSGNGEFAERLRDGFGPSSITVVEVDFVHEALVHGGQCRERESRRFEVETRQCVGNLDLQRGCGIPFASQSFDRAIASLLVSYVREPERLLREIYRILKPGGRAVISSMVQDADGMMLFHDGLYEYATNEARASLGRAVDGVFDALVRDFLNDGSRLLDLEERGQFRFWDASELRFAVANAGFVDVEVRHGFGDPPQAVIVSAGRA